MDPKSPTWRAIYGVEVSVPLLIASDTNLSALCLLPVQHAQVKLLTSSPG